MKHLILLFFATTVVFFAQSQACETDANASDGICCDPDEGGFNAFFCPFSNPYIWNGGETNGNNSDIDCGPVTDTICTTIPLDGGLSLLAIAGGGLATAAMRRRGEEELLEKEA